MSSPIKFSLRFIVMCLLLMWLTSVYGEMFIKPLLPLYKWEIRTIADQYRILSFGLDNEGFDRVIRIKVALAKPVYIAGNFLIPDARGVAIASTTIAHVWQMTIVCLAMIFAWPPLSMRTCLARLAIALPVLILLTMLDVPLVLLASLWDLIIQNTAPDTFSILVLWNSILEQGGRLTLGLTAGVLAVLGAKNS